MGSAGMPAETFRQKSFMRKEGGGCLRRTFFLDKLLDLLYVDVRDQQRKDRSRPGFFFGGRVCLVLTTSSVRFALSLTLSRTRMGMLADMMMAEESSL